MSLSASITKLVAYIPQMEARNEKVSKVDVAWQLDHSLRVLIEVSKSMVASDPGTYQAKFNLRFRILSALNWIPRGKGRTPKAVMAQETISKEGLQQKVIEAKQLLQRVEKLSDKHYFDHPLFGHIKKRQALRFLNMHTQHHLKIVREIVAKQP